MDLKLLKSVMRAFSPQSKGHLNVPEKLNFKAAVFDLDGVVTQTAHLHEESWKRLFDEFLLKKRNEKKSKGGGGEQDQLRPFDEVDYLTYVDGRPRTDGGSHVLAPVVTGRATQWCTCRHCPFSQIERH